MIAIGNQRRIEGLKAATQRRMQGEPPVSPGRRYYSSYDVVAGRLGISSSSVQRTAVVRRADPSVFRRMLDGDFQSIADAERAAGIQTAAERRREAGAQQTALAKHLQPLNKYLANWTAAAFKNVTPSEARRLLPQVRRAHYALLDIERDLEQRAIVSRALR
jgi:hypothetical protein